MEIPQDYHLHFHLTYHYGSINQYQNLLFLQPKVLHLISHQRNPRFLHIMHQVTLTVDIQPFFLSNTQPNFSTNPFHLTFHHRGLLQLQILPPGTLPTAFPPDKNCFDNFSHPSLILSATTSVIPNNLPAYMPSLFPTPVPSELINENPSPGPEI